MPASNGFAINARLSAVAVWSSFYATIHGINNDKASRTVEEVPRSGDRVIESKQVVLKLGGLQTFKHQLLAVDLVQGVSQIDLIRS